MSKSKRFPVEVRERAVRLVLEHRGEYETKWAAITSVASKIGGSPETLRAGSARLRSMPDRGRA